MNRALLSVARGVVARRALHKGVDSSPPLRYISNGEKAALYGFIAVAFLSYPTYVLCTLDNLRPKGDNFLSEEVQAKIDEIRASRK